MQRNRPKPKRQETKCPKKDENEFSFTGKSTEPTEIDSSARLLNAPNCSKTTADARKATAREALRIPGIPRALASDVRRLPPSLTALNILRLAHRQLRSGLASRLPCDFLNH